MEERAFVDVIKYCLLDFEVGTVVIGSHGKKEKRLKDRERERESILISQSGGNFNPFKVARCLSDSYRSQLVVMGTYRMHGS